MSFRLVLGVGVLFKEQDSEYGKFSWLVKNVNSSDEKVQKGLWNENHKWEWNTPGQWKLWWRFVVKRYASTGGRDVCYERKGKRQDWSLRSLQLDSSWMSFTKTSISAPRKIFAQIFCWRICGTSRSEISSISCPPRNWELFGFENRVFNFGQAKRWKISREAKATFFKKDKVTYRSEFKCFNCGIAGHTVKE